MPRSAPCSHGDARARPDHGPEGRVLRRSGAYLRPLCILLMLGGSLAAPAKPTVGDSCSDDGGWRDALAGFVEIATMHPVPALCVRMVNPRVFHALEPALAAPSDTEIAAAFVPDRGEILLANDLDMSDVFDRSYLVHEMVHAQQYASGAALYATCAGTLEGEAYALQAKYLRANGRTHDAFVFDLLSMLQSACAHHYR